MAAARYSLAALLVWMALIAVGCQALVSHTPWWTSVVVTATVAMLGAGLLMALANNGARRAQLLGFVIAGGGYLALTLYGPLTHVGGQLLTTRVLFVLWNELEEPVTSAPAGSAPNANAWSSSLVAIPDGELGYEALLGASGAWFAPGAPDLESKRSYLFIGQCLWTVLLAFPAGLFASWLYARRLRRERAEKAAGTQTGAAP